MKAIHLVISDTCRATHGSDQNALEVALQQLRAEYRRAATGWQAGRGTKFHVVLTVEPPERKGGTP